MMQHDIRFGAIGRLDALPGFVRAELDEVIRRTENNRGLRLNLAINYGGRAEMVDAVKALVEDARAGRAEIDEAAISARLYTAGMPDPDLLIRTSGEMRVSNFLLWQIAYAELYVTDTLWPDFYARRAAGGDSRLPEARPPLRRSGPSCGGGENDARGGRRKRRPWRWRKRRSNRRAFQPDEAHRHVAGPDSAGGLGSAGRSVLGRSPRCWRRWDCWRFTNSIRSPRRRGSPPRDGRGWPRGWHCCSLPSRLSSQR